MGKLAIAAAAVLMLAGCYSHQATLEGRIRPLPDSRYEVSLPFFVDSPATSASAEATRHEVLSSFMSENGYCPQGWSIADRQVTTRNSNFLGSGGDIYYTVECKPA